MAIPYHLGMLKNLRKLAQSFRDYMEDYIEPDTSEDEEEFDEDLDEDDLYELDIEEDANLPIKQLKEKWRHLRNKISVMESRNIEVPDELYEEAYRLRELIEQDQPVWHSFPKDTRYKELREYIPKKFDEPEEEVELPESPKIDWSTEKESLLNVNLLLKQSQTFSEYFEKEDFYPTKEERKQTEISSLIDEDEEEYGPLAPAKEKLRNLKLKIHTLEKMNRPVADRDYDEVKRLEDYIEWLTSTGPLPSEEGDFSGSFREMPEFEEDEKEFEEEEEYIEKPRVVDELSFEDDEDEED